MSRGFIKEGDQEEIPRVPMRAYLPEGVSNYVTKEGLEALKEELKDLEAERVKAGDNYIQINFIDATMKLLIDRINNAVEVDLSKSKKDTASFGAWVRYNGRVVRIVGVDEAVDWGTRKEEMNREAVKWFAKAAEQGNVEAMYCLGECYRDGSGVDEDQKKAVEWFTKAAEQGHEEAKAELEFYNRRESEKAFEEDGFLPYSMVGLQNEDVPF